MGHVKWWCALVFATALALGSGCHKVFRGKVTQPNPLVHPNETLRVSEPITIVTGDMDLERPRNRGPSGGVLMKNERYPLKNRASFTVVSRDRLRFHVQIEHKWEEFADLHTWHAWIIDSQGRRFVPEVLEDGEPKHVVEMWDYEVRSVRRSHSHLGDIVAVNNDGHRRRQPLGSLSLYRGNGDYVFYSPDIFTPEIQWITLVVERRGMAFAFTWKFAEVEPEPDLRRFGAAGSDAG